MEVSNKMDQFIFFQNYLEAPRNPGQAKHAPDNLK